ncbi:MAG TPA: oligosaccharide flippase family protein, partial [Haloplasmataceae bacterium]
MKDSFYRKSALLILTNFTTSILGFIYSVTLSRKIGPEGIGLFSLISPISSLLLSILSGGLFLAVSKVISEYYAKRQVKNLHKTIKSTIIFNFVLSIIIIFTFLFLSRTISIHIIKDFRILSA